MPIIKPGQVITEDISKFEKDVTSPVPFDSYLRHPLAKDFAYMCKFSSTSDKFIIFSAAMDLFKNRSEHAYYPFELSYYFYVNILPVMISINNSTKQVTITVCPQNREIEKYLVPECLDFLPEMKSQPHERFGAIKLIFYKNSHTYASLVNTKVCAYLGATGAVILKESAISYFESKTPDELYKMGIIIGILKYDSHFTISGITTPDLHQMIKNQRAKYQPPV